LSLLLALLVGPVAMAKMQPAKAEPSKAARLLIEGLEDHPALRANVQAMVPALRFNCDAPRVRFRTYLRQARERADSALRALGHFNAVIETQIQEVDDCLIPKLIIDPGPAVRIDVVDIQIDGPFKDDPGAQRFMESLRLKEGDTLNQSVYDSTRDSLINRARARGFLDAHYTRRNLWVDPKANIARIELTLESGQRYRFGKINAKQNILNDDFLDRLIPAKPGDPYSSDQLATISHHLVASGYFADVRVRPNLDAREDGLVPVDVLLVERPRTGYEFQLGYGTDTGVRARVDVDRRWVNRRGHKWQAGLGLSERKQSIDTIYSIPKRLPLTDSLDFYAQISREDNNDIGTNAGTLGAQYSRLRRGWTQAIFTEYLYEHSRFGDDPWQGNHFLLGGGKLGLRKLDDPLFPIRGHSLDLKLQGAAEPLLSSTSLLQLKTRGVVSYPLGKLVLKARGDLGITWTNEFDRLPKSLRFFAGGDNSVRGYGYESLGPTNDDGQVIGGRYLFVISGEAMYPIRSNNWYVAAFVDSGNAFNHQTEIDLKTGAGVGVRWRSPIGMVRVDIAYPFDTSSPSPRLHVGIGADF